MAGEALGTTTLTQIGIVVRALEATAARAWTEMSAPPMPEISWSTTGASSGTPENEHWAIWTWAGVVPDPRAELQSDGLV